MSSGKKEVNKALKLHQQGLFKQEKDALDAAYQELYNDIPPVTPATTVGGAAPAPVPPIPVKEKTQEVLEYISARIKALEGVDPKNLKLIIDLNKKQKFLESYIEFYDKYNALGNDEDFFEFLEIGVDFESAEYTFGNGDTRKIKKPAPPPPPGPPSVTSSTGSDKWRIGMPLSASSVSIKMSSGQTLTVYKDKTMKFSISGDDVRSASPFVDIVLKNFDAKYQEWKRNQQGSPPSISYSLDKVKEPLLTKLREYLIRSTIYRYTHQSTDKLAAYSDIVDAMVRGGQLTYEEIEKLKLGYRNVNPKIPFPSETQFLEKHTKDAKFANLVKADIASKGIKAFLGGTAGIDEEKLVSQLLNNLFVKEGRWSSLDTIPEYIQLCNDYGMSQHSIEEALANKAGLEFQNGSSNEAKLDERLKALKLTTERQQEIKDAYPLPPPPPASPSP